MRKRWLCWIQRGEGYGLAASPSPVAGAGARAGGRVSLVPLSSASAGFSKRPKTAAAPWDQLPPPGETALSQGYHSSCSETPMPVAYGSYDASVLDWAGRQKGGCSQCRGRPLPGHGFNLL